jgi:hypothetical protein
VWFQDDARFGQQNTTTRLWAQTGSRPRCVQQQQFEYAGRPTSICLALFGAVSPSTGSTEAVITSCVNMNIMREHLSLISKRTQSERHAVIVVGGAASTLPG